MEERLGEVTAESEKGLIAIEHLDNYREQLRQKTIEARDMSLQLHSLEAELKEVKQFQAKHKLMEQELNELRIKAEKFPPLIVEITRLRSTCKSVTKTLQEQDKSIVAMREKSKTSETEMTRLKAEIRSLRDVESKLKEANTEIKRLQAMVGEVNALRVGAKNAEEERKNLEDQYKKMRRYIRRSAANMAPMTGVTKTNMFAVVQEEDNDGGTYAEGEDVRAHRSASSDAVFERSHSPAATAGAAAVQYSSEGGGSFAERMSKMSSFFNNMGSQE